MAYRRYKGGFVKGIMNAELPRQVAVDARNCYGCETDMVSSGVQKHCSKGKTITKTVSSLGCVFSSGCVY